MRPRYHSTEATKNKREGVEASRSMIEAPETPHHHQHAGIPWFDIMMGVAILCISVASLLTSLQSEKSMHALVEQNTRLVDAQSTPLFMLDSGNLEITSLCSIVDDQ